MRKSKKKMTALVITVAAMMIAVQIIFERFLSISTPMYRIGLTFIARAITGFCFGIFAGGLFGIGVSGFCFGIFAGGLFGIGVSGFCSLAADLIGTMMFYPSINPLISVSALFRGLLFGYSYRKNKEPGVALTLITAVCDQFIGGFLITSLGLILFSGFASTGMFWFGRAVQSLFLTIVEIPVLYSCNNFVFPRIRAYLNANGMVHEEKVEKEEKRLDD